MTIAPRMCPAGSHRRRRSGSRLVGTTRCFVAARAGEQLERQFPRCGRSTEPEQHRQTDGRHTRSIRSIRRSSTSPRRGSREAVGYRGCRWEALPEPSNSVARQAVQPHPPQWQRERTANPAIQSHCYWSRSTRRWMHRSIYLSQDTARPRSARTISHCCPPRDISDAIDTDSHTLGSRRVRTSGSRQYLK